VPADGVLTAAEISLLEAMAARIFPPTDTPGALEAGALDYILRALAGAYATLLPIYREGLRDLDERARTAFDRPFAELHEEQQDDLLRQLDEAGEGGRRGRESFFHLGRRHGLEGVFCEPQYGGNRDLIGWRLVGFPGQQLGYPDAYVNRVVDIPPKAGL